MLVKCICRNCAGHLEFEEENAGQKIKCPHCGFDTILFLPGAEEAEAEVAMLRSKLAQQRRLRLAAGALVILAGLGWALYHWGLPLVENLFPSLDNMFVSVLILLLLCLAIPCLVMWLLLPVFLFFQVRRVVALLGRIEENLRPTAPAVEVVSERSAEEVTEDARKM